MRVKYMPANPFAVCVATVATAGSLFGVSASAQTPPAAPPATKAAPAAAKPAPAAQAAPAPADTTKPAPAPAPVQPAAITPAAAAAAPPADTASPTSFKLSEALSSGTPMSASDVAKRAVQTSPGVAKAEQAAQRSQLAAEQTNIAIYPHLDFEARYTRLSDTRPDPISVAGMAFKFPQVLLNQGLFQARLVYPVSSVFFSVLPRYRAGLRASEAEQLKRTVEIQSVSAMAKESYYNYARTRAALMVARAALAQAEAHRKDVDALVTSGTVARVELMRADAQVASARVAVSRVEGQVAVARVSLCQLMHIELTDISVNEDLESVLPVLPSDSNAYLAAALQNRSEVKGLRKLADMNNELLDAQDGDKLPKLNIGGNADLSNPNQRVSSYENKWAPSWAAFASLSWSPNDYATAKNGADQVRANLAQTHADLEALQDGLRTEIAQAVESYNAARASMESALTGIAAAEESYRVRREQFRAGAATATDVIDSESELRNARLDLVNASIDGRIAKTRLDRAIEAQ